eukprot:955255-Ditylum_brightwellii.AAC.1
METNAAAEALANLAQATEADYTTVVNLTTANTQLTTKVVNLTTKLNAKDRDISALTEKIRQLTTAIEKLSNKQTPSGDRNYNHTNNNAVFYCWSHGVTRTRNLQSALCCNPKEGHKTEVTFSTEWVGAPKTSDKERGQIRRIHIK